MSDKYKLFASVEPSSNCVKAFLFRRTLDVDGVKVEVSKGWTPEDQDKRIQDWTEEDVELEYNKCDQVVNFNDLLRKRHSNKKSRRVHSGDVHVLTEEETLDAIKNNKAPSGG